MLMDRRVLANKKTEWLEINQWVTGLTTDLTDYKLSVPKLGVRLGLPVNSEPNARSGREGK